MTDSSRKPLTSSASYTLPDPYAGLNKGSQQLAGEALSRRLAREQALYDKGFPVAGHNPGREPPERER